LEQNGGFFGNYRCKIVWFAVFGYAIEGGERHPLTGDHIPPSRENRVMAVEDLRFGPESTFSVFCALAGHIRLLRYLISQTRVSCPVYRPSGQQT
jgi:hypothetical protein